MLFAEFTFFETINPLSYQVQQDKFEVGCSVIKPHCFMLTIILIPPRLQIGGLRVTSFYFCCTDSNTQREEIHALPLLGSQTDRITNSNSLASIKTQTLLFKLGLITRESHQASFRFPMIRNLNQGVCRLPKCLLFYRFVSYWLAPFEWRRLGLSPYKCQNLQ